MLSAPLREFAALNVGRLGFCGGVRRSNSRIAGGLETDDSCLSAELPTLLASCAAIFVRAWAV